MRVRPPKRKFSTHKKDLPTFFFFFTFVLKNAVVSQPVLSSFSFLIFRCAVVLVADPGTFDPVHHPRDNRGHGDPVRVFMVYDVYSSRPNDGELAT